MLPFYKKYWRTAFDIALIALTVYLTMLTFSYLYKIATPIFFSFIIYMCIEPLAKRLNKIGIKKSIASGISILLFSIVALAAFSGLAYVIMDQTKDFIEYKLPEYQRILENQIASNTGLLQGRIEALPQDWVVKITEYISSATEKLPKLIQTVFMSLYGYVTSFSTFLFNLIIGVVLAYFLSIEIKMWKKTANEKTPNTFKKAFFFLRENVFKGIAGYIKAQAKMISITFIVIFVSLLLLGVNNALMISVIAAIFDILPLLGVGTIFIPWIIYLFIVGQTSLAIWVSVLFLVVVLARQILEPKITGDTLGVSAFTMLAFMIISLKLFGIAGVILSPILIILIKALYDQGFFHRWIRTPQDEFDLVSPVPEPPPGPKPTE
ncbi:sporulation integral membrane protein YtvI [Paenibacillus radicis (ex Gao et al. 2016)]|uniref:Sporulation integral membrane protein YtvI n=1 Tax=Paenibacillus radicis (ex Gao et al. 2016) TaxID=1737354 RepID=A0A917HM77_9BACL|nr:sporulation integral membrane protein YtvI [Paenibacillus radicis (ex Gao et al. 2016)]GGG83950.1 sporulation integral membrane protein YtvI [Paenibacillus radicis (ex Gao et al. 2016)]